MAAQTDVVASVLRSNNPFFPKTKGTRSINNPNNGLIDQGIEITAANVAICCRGPAPPICSDRTGCGVQTFSRFNDALDEVEAAEQNTQSNATACSVVQ